MLPDESAKRVSPIQATRCRSGAEASCWYSQPEQALWVWASQHIPGMVEYHEAGYLPSARPMRHSLRQNRYVVGNGVEFPGGSVAVLEDARH